MSDNIVWNAEEQHYDGYPTLGSVGQFGWRQVTSVRNGAEYEVFNIETDKVLAYYLYEEDAEADAVSRSEGIS